MKIEVTITGRDWDGSDIDMIYRPKEQTIINRMEEEEAIGNDMTPFRAIIATAMLKWYGSRAFFWRDRGLPEGIYGQVCRACDNNGNDCITPRVLLTIRVDGHDVCSGDDLAEIESTARMYDAYSRKWG